MQHLDEGTIHALLDGELAGAEGTQILAHIETCEECSSRVAEERLIQAQAERMILELDEPASRAGPAAVPPFTTDEPFVLPPPSPDQLVRQGPPIVLVPDRDTDRPRLPLRYLAAAAMLVVAAGAGYLAIGARRTPAVAPPHVFTDAPVTITLPPEDGFERRTDGRTESAATAGSGDSIARDLVVGIRRVPETRSDRAWAGAPRSAIRPRRSHSPTDRLPRRARPPRHRSGRANPWFPRARRMRNATNRPSHSDGSSARTGRWTLTRAPGSRPLWRRPRAQRFPRPPHRDR